MAEYSNTNISFSIADTIEILNKSQSIDRFYGVYDTVQDALDVMILRGLTGRIVAVYSNKSEGKVKLYTYNHTLVQLDPISAEGVQIDDLNENEISTWSSSKIVDYTASQISNIIFPDGRTKIPFHYNKPGGFSKDEVVHDERGIFKSVMNNNIYNLPSILEDDSYWEVIALKEFNTSSIIDLINIKLDKVELVSSLPKAYVKNEDGTQSMMDIGGANGLLQLDEYNKIKVENLPSYLVSPMTLGGVLNVTSGTALLSDAAKTRLNTPLSDIVLTNDDTPITGFVDNEGVVYIAEEDGTLFGLNILIGDWFIGIGSSWVVLPNTDTVRTVNNETGDIIITLQKVLNIDNVVEDQSLVLKSSLNSEEVIIDTSQISIKTNTKEVILTPEGITIAKNGNTSTINQEDVTGAVVHTLPAKTGKLAHLSDIETKDLPLLEGTTVTLTNINTLILYKDVGGGDYLNLPLPSNHKGKTVTVKVYEAVGTIPLGVDGGDPNLIVDLNGNFQTSLDIRGVIELVSDGTVWEVIETKEDIVLDFNPSITNPQNGETLIYNNGVWENAPIGLARDIRSTIDVGGIPANTLLLEGTSFTDIIESLLVTTLPPVIVEPKLTFTSSTGSTRLYETGTNLPTLTFTSSFDRGAIRGVISGGSWNTSQLQDYRSGTLIDYKVNGTTQGTSTTKQFINYKIPQGNTSFIGTASHAQGPQPKNSVGGNYSTPLAAGTVTDTTITFIGSLKVFAGAGVVSNPRSLDGEFLYTIENKTGVNKNTFKFQTGTVSNIMNIYIPDGFIIDNVTDLSNNFANLTSVYVLQAGPTFVKDAEGIDKAYNYYKYESAVSYSSSATHRVTIKQG